MIEKIKHLLVRNHLLGEQSTPDQRSYCAFQGVWQWAMMNFNINWNIYRLYLFCQASYKERSPLAQAERALIACGLLLAVY
ncbi:hypothetical protein AB0758_24485 [Tolypothrix bouteillei VB521301_2]